MRAGSSFTRIAPCLLPEHIFQSPTSLSSQSATPRRGPGNPPSPLLVTLLMLLLIQLPVFLNDFLSFFFASFPLLSDQLRSPPPSICSLLSLSTTQQPSKALNTRYTVHVASQLFIFPQSSFSSLITQTALVILLTAQDLPVQS